MIVQWNQPNLITVFVPVKDAKIASEAFSVSQKILPGMNEIPDKTWEDIKKNPILAHYIEEGQLKEASVKGKEGTVGMTPKEASVIIKGTFDHQLLKKWKSLDARREIQSAIETQLDDIESKTRKDKTDDDDDDE